ncbi:unnamed protein product [Soboliphyme baturini]|uniref:IGFBP N-terminal domain-containing protein n=1 Tax=Soboliphyme baturini TaxID=241478 RepID=A0A183IPW3_9BILA|nr:unnamed protein product [Soboliphyme baturini]
MRWSPPVVAGHNPAPSPLLLTIVLFHGLLVSVVTDVVFGRWSASSVPDCAPCGDQCSGMPKCYQVSVEDCRCCWMCERGPQQVCGRNGSWLGICIPGMACVPMTTATTTTITSHSHAITTTISSDSIGTCQNIPQNCTNAETVSGRVFQTFFVGSVSLHKNINSLEGRGMTTKKVSLSTAAAAASSLAPANDELCLMATVTSNERSTGWGVDGWPVVIQTTTYVAAAVVVC